MAEPPYDESARRSDRSPGIVEDAEDLLRILIHPDHVVEGQIIPAHVSLADLRDRGYSVDRRRYASREMLHAS